MEKTYEDFIKEAESACGVSHNSRLWTDCFQVIGALAVQLEQQEKELIELRTKQKAISNLLEKFFRESKLA